MHLHFLCCKPLLHISFFLCVTVIFLWARDIVCYSGPQGHRGFILKVLAYHLIPLSIFLPWHLSFINDLFLVLSFCAFRHIVNREYTCSDNI